MFIVKDKNFYSSAHDGKSRRVVCVGVEDKKMKVIPVRKNNSYVSLSNFDGNRIFNFKRIKKIPIDKVYENRTFKNSNNDFLTKNEKNELRRKLIS